MRARLVVFPIKGRTWCFSRTVDPATTHFTSSSPPAPLSLKDLWKKIGSSGGAGSVQANVELVVDFVSDKMNRAWGSLEKAPKGTVKSRIHGLGLKLLSRVRPSEIFLKSVSKDFTEVDITFPASLNPRLVRRRLRHIASRGTINHRRYFYGSITLLPLTGALSVLPLPNIPFFWVLFRAYSHWRALQGSERLLLLVSNCSKSWNSLKREKASTDDSGNSLRHPPWVLQPSEELERLLVNEDTLDGLSNKAVSSICKQYHLDSNDVIKFRDLL